jgi:hypothetical protein
MEENIFRRLKKALELKIFRLSPFIGALLPFV